MKKIPSKEPLLVLLKRTEDSNKGLREKADQLEAEISANDALIFWIKRTLEEIYARDEDSL